MDKAAIVEGALALYGPRWPGVFAVGSGVAGGARPQSDLDVGVWLCAHDVARLLRDATIAGAEDVVSHRTEKRRNPDTRTDLPMARPVDGDDHARLRGHQGR